MIKAIIFDFFGVICSDDYWRYVKTDSNTDSNFRNYSEEVNLGDITWQDFVRKIAEATSTTVEDVNKLYATEKIDPRLIGLIHHLRNDYKIGLLTNAHHDFINGLLDKNKLRELFDVIVISSELKLVKPDPQIFKYLLSQLSLSSDEVVYIDDLDRHVQAAAKLGIKTIKYENFNQLQMNLQELLNHK